MKKNCQNCRYYRAFYTKAYISFYKEEAGFCSVRQQAVSKDKTCKSYSYRRPANQTVSIEHIDEVIKEIEELKTIYRAD